jgi:hypothetical protein
MTFSSRKIFYGAQKMNCRGILHKENAKPMEFCLLAFCLLFSKAHENLANTRGGA